MAEIDMTKPQPCTVFQYAPETAASTLAWVAKLNEETRPASHGFTRLDMTKQCVERCSGL